MTEREMKRRRAERRAKARRARSRRIALTVCLMLAVCLASIGGTIAWLTATTTTVVNTFSPSGIAIDLKETMKSDGTVVEDGVTDWSADLVPGKTYKKDPVVSVLEETDVPVYLFVKVEEGVSDTYLNYTLAWDNTDATNTEYTGWTKLEGTTSEVYYRTVDPADQKKSWPLLVDDQITVDPDLQKADDDETTLSMPAGADCPEMTFTAYAIQTHGMDAKEGKTSVQVAWENVSGETITVTPPAGGEGAGN